MVARCTKNELRKYAWSTLLPIVCASWLLIHSTAGFIDPGFDGHVTLELSNVANLPITIYPEMKIGQLSFVQMSEPAETPYGSGGLGSKYQGQRGPTPSKYWQNFPDAS